MSIEQRKEKEGDAELAQAAKCLKTGLMSRWKPDWESAAAHFEKAASCFRVAKAYPKAIEAFVKASEAHTNIDSDFMAAKHLETGAVIARDSSKDPAQAATFFEMASKIQLEATRTEDLLQRRQTMATGSWMATTSAGSAAMIVATSKAASTHRAT